MERFLENLIIGISIGSVYSLIGMGIVIIYKATRIFNFATGAAVALSSFIFLGFAESLHLNVMLSIILSVMVGFAVGVISERLFLRPMIGQPLLASIMMTLALGSILEGSVYLFGRGTFKPFQPLFEPEFIDIGEMTMPSIYIVSLLSMIVLFSLLGLFFKHTKIGLGMRAAAEDHKVAQSKGVTVTRVFMISWGICILICSLAGILLGSLTGAASHLLVPIALKAFAVVLCGGLESFLGCMIMGPFMGVAEVFSMAYLVLIVPWSGIDKATPYILMLLIIIFKREGLFGLKTIERI